MTTPRQPEVKIIEEENDFPMKTVTFLRIGSAHAESHSSRDAELQQFLARIRDEIAAEFEADAVSQPVIIEYKD